MISCFTAPSALDTVKNVFGVHIKAKAKYILNLSTYKLLNLNLTHEIYKNKIVAIKFKIWKIYEKESEHYISHK